MGLGRTADGQPALLPGEQQQQLPEAKPTLLEIPVPLCQKHSSEKADSKFLVATADGQWRYVGIPVQCGSVTCRQCSNSLSSPMPFLRGADLNNANLRNARLEGADLSYALLDHADLSCAGLQDAILHNARLTNANLRFARLQRARLGHANLHGANLNNASLTSADLTGALLYKAPFRYADLGCAKLRCTGISYTDLSRASLAGADFGGAKIYSGFFNGSAITASTSFEKATCYQEYAYGLMERLSEEQKNSMELVVANG